jgi:type II secretory pathway pseudopilin PulG
MLVVIAVISIITAIAIPAVTGINGTAKTTEARDFAESLNKAVRSYSQACWEIGTAADNSGTTDEFLVLRSIQYTWPAAQLKPGSPFFSARYNPSASSDSTVHRIRWNGKAFEVLEPGTAGTGFLKPFTGADFSTEYTFPNGYTPVGPS